MRLNLDDTACVEPMSKIEHKLEQRAVNYVHHKDGLRRYDIINRHILCKHFAEHGVPPNYIHIPRCEGRSYKEQWEFDNKLFSMIFIDKMKPKDIIKHYPDMKILRVYAIKTGKARSLAVSVWREWIESKGK